MSHARALLMLYASIKERSAIELHVQPKLGRSDSWAPQDLMAFESFSAFC